MASVSKKAKNIKAACLGYEEIKLGDVYSFERKLTNEDLRSFANLTGDFNPLHTDPEFGLKSRFGSNVIQGMLAAGLFSTLVGMHCPGEKCVYLSQTLDFKSPIFPGDLLTVKGRVIDKTDSTKLVTIRTEILVKDKVAVAGEAKTLVSEER